MIVLCSISWPYEETVRVIEELTKVEVSSKEAQLIVGEEGERVREEEREEIEEFYEGSWKERVEEVKESPERIYIELDGVYINDREGEGGMEGKVGVIHLGVEEIGGGWWRGYMWGDMKAVRNWVREYIMRLFRRGSFPKGIMNTGEIIVKGDGAGWIKGIGEEYFLESRYILDWYHLREKVWRAIGSRRVREEIGEGYEEIGRWLLGKLWRGEVEEVLGRLKEIRDGLEKEEGREKLEELRKYIQNNEEGIGYAQLEEEGIVIGSGGIEKGVDLLVCRRQKRRGMSWTREGADKLLALRLLYFNHRWDDHWQQRSPLPKAA